MDYKKVLDEATFKKFAELRAIRKKVAAEEGLAAVREQILDVTWPSSRMAIQHPPALITP